MRTKKMPPVFAGADTASVSSPSSRGVIDGKSGDFEAGVSARSGEVLEGTNVSAPVLVCPFSGQSLEIVETSGGFMVVSPYGWYSRLFVSRAQAVEWAGKRDGEQRYNRRPEIKVVGEVQPPEEHPFSDMVQ